MKNPKSKIQNPKSVVEHSAGGCVYREAGGEIVWLVGKHSGYHKWVLPKGLIEAGETAEQAAVREVEEEMAVKAEIVGDEPVHTIQYSYQAVLKMSEDSTRRVKTYQENTAMKEEEEIVTVDKTVDFFLMKYVSGEVEEHGWEMEAGGWFGFDEAMEKLAFEDEKEALQRVHAKIRDLDR